MQRYTVYFYLETALHVSGGTTTHHQERILTVSTGSGICQTVTATCRYSDVRQILCLTTSTIYTSNNLPRMKKPEAASVVLGSS
jgi:hypothetical protein